MEVDAGNAGQMLARAATLAALLLLNAAGESWAAEPESLVAAAKTESDPRPPALQGRITDETGAPVTDATLELHGTREVGPEGAQYFHTKTDENGNYRFDAVEASDEFRLQITSIGWVGITKWNEMPRLQLSPDATMERDFKLQRACRVTFRMLDEDGQPIAGVRIYVTSLTAERFGGGRDGVSTDKLGWATVGGLAPSDADYLFGTMHDDYAFAKLQLKLNDPAVKPSHVLVLAEGQDVPGRAICSDDKPAVGWTVRVMPDWWRFGVSPNGETVAEDGSFTVPHVLPGSYNVSIGVPTGDGMTRVEPVQSGVQLPAGGPLDLKLRLPSPQSMGVIAGTVKFSGGAPSRGVTVEARTEGGDFQMAMIRPGAREFRITPVSPGRYTLRFAATDVEEKTIENITAPTEDLEVELNVVARPRLVGRVATKDAATLKLPRVRAVKSRTLRGLNYVQDPQWREVNDPEGRFEIETVGPGVYQVLATADGLATARSADINTDEYGGEPILLELDAGSSLSGRVVDETGLPIERAKVTPLSATLAAQAQGGRDAPAEDNSVLTVAGEFTLPHLTPGKEVLSVTHPDYCRAIIKDVEVPEGAGNVPPITLIRGGSVRGRVFDSNGQPDAGVTLQFENEMGNQGLGDSIGRLATVVTNRAGEFEVHHLPAELCHVFRDDEWNQAGVVRQAILPVSGETHRLDLGGENAVIGQIAVNGTPLDSTRIVMAGESPHFGVFKANAQTDAQGRFVFWGLAVGRRSLYYLAPRSRNDWIKVREVDITPETADLGAIDLHTATVTIEVHGLSESASAGARVSLLNYSPVWANSSQAGVVAPRAGADAPWVIEHVPRGKYEAVSIRKDGVRLRREIEVGVGDREVSISLDWPAGAAQLHGKLSQAAMGGPGVFNPPNLWSKDRRISAVLYSRDPSKEAYSLSELPAGEYYITDKDVRDAEPVLELTLAEGDDKTLDLTAENRAPKPIARGFISVLCYTEEGVPLPTADIVVTGESGDATPHNSQNARTTFVGEPGPYSLTVSFPGFESQQQDVTLKAPNLDGRPAGKFEHLFRLKPLTPAE